MIFNNSLLQHKVSWVMERGNDIAGGVIHYPGRNCGGFVQEATKESTARYPKADIDYSLRSV